VEAESDVGHSRTQRLPGVAGIVDCRRRRKNAGKERMQRAAIIGMVACSSVRMRASVVPMAVNAMSVGLVTNGLVVTVTGMRNGSSGSRVSL
jgi:hypothetical protein